MASEDIEVGGLQVHAVQARRWLAEINQLEKRYGRLPTDDELLEAATDLRSSLHAVVFNLSTEDAARAYYIARVQWIMRHIAAITTAVNGGKASFRMFIRTADGYGRVTEVEPESSTAEAIGRRLRAEIVSAQRRAEALRVILGSANRSRADAVIRHLKGAEQAVSRIDGTAHDQPKRRAG